MRFTKKYLSAIVIIILILCVYNVSSAETGWKKEGDYLCYYFGDEKATGTHSINYINYEFTEDGHLVGEGKIKRIYYSQGFDDYYIGTDCKLLTKWQIIDSETYYFDPETGCKIRDKIFPDDGILYVFQNDGTLLRDDWYMGGETYADKDGKALVGYQQIGKEKYYFDNNGVMQKGFQTIDGKVHYFKDNSLVKKSYPEVYGWQKIEDALYYFDPSTGIMQTTNVAIDGRNYVFGEDGVLQISNNVVLRYPYDDKISCYDAELKYISGWLTYDNETYYSNYGEAQIGLQIIDNSYYYFNLR